MANLISGLKKDFSEATSGFSGGGDGGDTQPKRDYSKGISDAKSAYEGFSTTRKEEQEATAAAAAAQEEEGSKPGKTKKIGGFFKSAFKYGSAAAKGEKAGEELTGESIKNLNPFKKQ